MSILQPYRSALGIKTAQELVGLFLDTLLDTNRTHDFYVDWDKVRRTVETLKAEIAILGTLTSSKDPIKELRKLLSRYPEAAKAIPILIAVHDMQFRVLEPGASTQRYTDYDFGKQSWSPEDIEQIVRFCSKTGIFRLLSSIQVLKDYVTGVEVGTDTNARKNRSGETMQTLIYPILEHSTGEMSRAELLVEKKFSWVEKAKDIPVPSELRDRKFDMVILTPTRRFNLETNYYQDAGSKPQEIVSSYIRRQEELKQAGWDFIWISDGPGWRKMASQIRVAFGELDYVLNYEFVRRGVLTQILAS